MKNKIIQFGEGGFLRGFFDWMLWKVNNATDFGGSVVVVQPIENGMCDALLLQSGRYTHICRGAEGVETAVIDVISDCVKPYEEFDKYINLAQDPDFRFVVSNTTEAGIAFDPEDRFEDAPASSFPAKLTQLLFKRYELGLDGFVFLPCELIDKNGECLKECILKYAELWNLGTDFKEFVEKENIFCNTLVDRINTGYPKDEEGELGIDDKLLNTSEFFHLWVIEGYDGLFKELPLDKCGLNVLLTNDLERYRTRKVRILNGAHTCITPFGLLSGLDTVKSCVENKGMCAFLNRCVYEEIIPTIDMPEDELREYADNVIQRFSNPYINHYLSSISLNSVSKFKVRVLPSILEYIKRFNRMPENLLFAFGKLIDFYRTDKPKDSKDITDFMKTATLGEILANEALWGRDISFLEGEMKKYVDK